LSASTVAAIVYDAGNAADARLAQAVAACRAQGAVMTGLVQHNDGECAVPGFAMALEDITSGRRIALTDITVAKSQGCMLDMGGLAEAAATLAPELHGGSDCVVVNKFGRQEMLGRGLRAEMAALVCAGLPVLTTVRRDFLPAFEAFAGEDWARIEPEPRAILAWLKGLKQHAAAE
jgi:hypothetical protein